MPVWWQVGGGLYQICANRQLFQRRPATSTWAFLCAKLLKELKFQSRIGGLDHVRDVGVAGSNPVTPTKKSKPYARTRTPTIPPSETQGNSKGVRISAHQKHRWPEFGHRQIFFLMATVRAAPGASRSRVSRVSRADARMGAGCSNQGPPELLNRRCRWRSRRSRRPTRNFPPENLFEFSPPAP
jgi:hypothetical protein